MSVAIKCVIPQQYLHLLVHFTMINNHSYYVAIEETCKVHGLADSGYYKIHIVMYMHVHDFCSPKIISYSSNY